MKKKSPILIAITAVLLLQLFGMCRAAAADDRHYVVSGYAVDVSINGDGSADIEERITYDFTGKFNGILRDIDFSGTGGIEGLRIFTDKNGSPSEFSRNSTQDIDYGGKPGTYNFALDGNIAHLKIFEPSSNERKLFTVKYKFRDVVTKYSDIAAFNRKIIDTGWTVEQKNIAISITLPEGAKKEEIKVFGHGPLTGESKIIDERHVSFTCDRNTPGSFIETLVLFPTSLVPDCRNTVAKEALPEFLANEKKLADEANAERERARKVVEEYRKRQMEEQARIAAVRPIGAGIAAILIIFWFALIIYIYLKYDKEFKPNFQGKYYRELPGEYTPAEMSCLMSMGSVATRDVTATLMDLVRKEQLLLTVEKHTKKGIFKNKEITDYIVSINPNAPAINLKSHESFLLDWFINGLGDGNSLVLDDIAKLTKNVSGARRFKEDYNKWGMLAKSETGKNGFFDETCRTGKAIGLLASVAYLGTGIFILSYFKSGLGAALIAQSIVMALFSVRLRRRTAYGNEQHAMWEAFRNFLKDFSRLDKAEMPSIVIWEHYLVYAVSLGVAKEVIRQLPLVFTDADLQDGRLTYMYGYTFANFEAFTHSFDTTISSVDSAIERAMSVANSTLSSSSGGGGGFSGGTSGGGGGGGGGGAF